MTDTLTEIGHDHCRRLLQDMIRILFRQRLPLEDFHKKFAIQLNDTHPAIAVPELMRLLIDEHAMDWDVAWEITERTLSYTNHTLLPEALECWPLPLFARLLPRHLEIIYQINEGFLDKVRIACLGDSEQVARISIIGEDGERSVRMAHLACVGSHAINGVAELHTELLKNKVLKDFYALSPAKFSNKTNGVTPRRWLATWTSTPTSSPSTAHRSMTSPRRPRRMRRICPSRRSSGRPPSRRPSAAIRPP